MSQDKDNGMSTSVRNPRECSSNQLAAASKLFLQGNDRQPRPIVAAVTKASATSNTKPATDRKQENGNDGRQLASNDVKASDGAQLNHVILENKLVSSLPPADPSIFDEAVPKSLRILVTEAV